MSKINLNWWDHVYCFFQTIWRTYWYGLDGAIKKAEKEIKDLKRKIYILENWKK